ncbi:MAG: DUF4230 domain-containing protein [Mogibacterium sp.]|nr:DUF4230 domain-containing protein [Mogibacterium sp.]
MKKILSALLILLIGAALAVGGMYYWNLKKQPQVDAKGLMERLEECSELTVAKNYYTGIVRFNEGTVPLINKNGFTMKYEAVIDAGFDLEKVSIEVTDDQVLVTVPNAEIQSINIDPNSLEFYDNKTSLFKTDRKEATKKALQEAQKDAEENAYRKGLLEEADKRAEVIFKGILEGGVGNREIVVRHEGDAVPDAAGEASESTGTEAAEEPTDTAAGSEGAAVEPEAGEEVGTEEAEG